MEHLDDELLFGYLDGELPGDEALRVEQHLAGCGQCSAQLAHWQGVFAAVEEIPEQPFAGDVAARVLADLETPLDTDPRIRWIGAAQLILALLGLGVAWPSLRAAMPPLELALPDMSHWWTRLSAEWYGLVAVLGTRRESIADISPPPALDLSLTLGLTLLVIAVLFWAIGARFILQGVETNQGGHS